MRRSGRACVAVCFLLSFLAPVASAQQNPDGVLPVTQYADPLPLLLRDSLVHQELKLSGSQLRSLGELNDKLDMLMWTARNQTAERGSEIYRDISQESLEGVRNLFNSTQVRRLQEIQLWTIGMKAFLLPDVIERLAIDENHQQEIREVLRKTDEQVQELQKKALGGEPIGPLEKKSRELRLAEQKQIAALLTRDQVGRFVAMLGKKVDVAKLGHVKFKAPELRGSGPWLNSSPLTMGELQGKVVALHFWTFG